MIKQLALDIVKGQVAFYAKQAAESQGVTDAELAALLREVADKLEKKEKPLEHGGDLW